MAILNTVKIGFCAASLATVLGVMAAIAAMRTDLPFRRVTSVLFIALVILPQIVLAIGLFPLMVKLGPLEPFRRLSW